MNSPTISHQVEVITGTNMAYTTSSGVLVVPISCLKIKKKNIAS